MNCPFGLRTCSLCRTPEFAAHCPPVILERMACVVLPPCRQQCLGRPSRHRDRGTGADVDKRPALGRLQAISGCILEELVSSVGSITSLKSSPLTEVIGGSRPLDLGTLFEVTYMHAVMQTKVPAKIPRWTSLGEPSALEAARRRSLLAHKQTNAPQCGHAPIGQHRLYSRTAVPCRICNILN